MATTTVDLDEYRQLVSTNAFLTSEANRFSKEAHDARENNQTLKSEVEALMASEGALQKEVADLERELKIVREKRDFWEESSAFQRGNADNHWRSFDAMRDSRTEVRAELDTTKKALKAVIGLLEFCHANHE